jgi:hypothetical protein
MKLYFFDFIFYRVYNAYIKWGENDVPGIYALAVISLFPLINVSTLIFFTLDFFKLKLLNYDKALIFLCFIILVWFHYYRIYKKIGVTNLLDKWKNVPKQKQNKLFRWMLFYLIVSIIAVFISIIY